MMVYIPWRDTGCQWRSRALGYVTKWWTDMGHVVTYVDSGDDKFSRAASRNLAVRSAGSGVICVADADMFCDSLDVDYQGGLHLPYTRYNALTCAATADRYLGRVNNDIEAFNESQSTAGIMIVDCDEWRAAGGMCEEYVGWGFEDTDFSKRIKITRTEGPAYHLWHPPGFSIGSAEYNANYQTYLRRNGGK